MKENLVAFFCGLLFSIGLGISGMTQPNKVTSFLDFFGDWDPSLVFVMIGGILVYALGYRFAVKRPKPFFSDSFKIPTLRKVDRPLAAGSALFGVGWGLAGYCPGPGLVALASFHTEPILFVISMVGGMAAFEFKKRRGSEK